MHSHDLALLGWSDDLADALAAQGDGTPARVRRVDRGRVALLGAPSHLTAAAPRDPLAPGDWVALDDHGAISATLPRRSLLRRRAPDAVGSVQLLAANIDHVLLVRPLDVPVSIRRLAQLAGLAWDAGAVPVVVLTKADLHAEPERAAGEAALALPGVDVLTLSSTDGHGLDAVRALVAGRSTALVGESGAGKSTLVNLLLGRGEVAVGEVRRDGQGRHTTTWRELLVLPEGGTLIDTPGMRVVAAAGFGAGHDHVRDLAARCRFPDCGHASEPGCAITAALASGELAAEALHAYQVAERDAARLARREDPLARQELRRRYQALNREGRERGRAKRQGRDGRR